jgi:hypothetical protein
VALSSTEPADFPLARTALELGFDLPALRAPCKKEAIRAGTPLQPSARAISANCAKFVARPGRRAVGYDRLVHLRMPSIDHGFQSVLWALLFFLILWLGMLAIGVSRATALILSLVAAGAIFLFVRLRGEDVPGR